MKNSERFLLGNRVNLRRNKVIIAKSYRHQICIVPSSKNYQYPSNPKGQ